MEAEIALGSNKDLLLAQNSRQMCLFSGQLNPEDSSLSESGNEGKARVIFSESTVGILSDLSSGI